MDLEDINNKEIILIDKPKGITSFDVIRIIKKKYNIQKAGHAGTLDPNATGLMIIGIGNGTKKLNQYLKLDKVYNASILIGISTDTFDIDGKIINNQNIEKINLKNIKKELKNLIGKINLQVPIYSSIKINGQRLYKIASLVDKRIKLSTFLIKLPLSSNLAYSFRWLFFISELL